MRFGRHEKVDALAGKFKRACQDTRFRGVLCHCEHASGFS